MVKGREGWRGVRRWRAAPPALARQADDRKLVFQSALAQAEELWDAAAVVGPASRPLPLFYCVSQAGRAVCAAWTREDKWRPRTHGLRRRESSEQVPEKRVFDYAAAVTQQPLGSYAMVANATASPTFGGFATSAELWASLPGWPTPDSIFAGVPRCLTLEPIMTAGDQRPMVQQLIAPTHAVVHSLSMGITELSNAYPTTAGIEQDGVRASPLGRTEPVFKFVNDDGSLRCLTDVGVRPFWSEGVSGSLVVRPQVGEAAIAPPSEFLTLWALLFCLSELARYYPDTWVCALDPDRSPAAVTIEHGLELALERTPALINRALEGAIAELTQEQLRRRRAQAAGLFNEDPPK